MGRHQRLGSGAATSLYMVSCVGKGDPDDASPGGSSPRSVRGVAEDLGVDPRKGGKGCRRVRTWTGEYWSASAVADAGVEVTPAEKIVLHDGTGITVDSTTFGRVIHCGGSTYDDGIACTFFVTFVTFQPVHIATAISHDRTNSNAFDSLRRLVFRPSIPKYAQPASIRPPSAPALSRPSSIPPRHRDRLYPPLYVVTKALVAAAHRVGDRERRVHHGSARAVPAVDVGVFEDRVGGGQEDGGAAGGGEGGL